MAFILEPLKYANDALEPVIDKETVAIHHDKHHQGYVTNFNSALAGTGWEDRKIEDILRNLDKISADKRTAVKNYGGGHFNHTIYWEVMTPGGAKEPIGNLKKAIEKKFGSFADFKQQFEDKGKGQFGSGWVSLIEKDGELSIVNHLNQDTPFSDGYNIVITNDVWEHAYYLKYQNKRPDYLSAWWKLVNWDIAEKRYMQEM